MAGLFNKVRNKLTGKRFLISTIKKDDATFETGSTLAVEIDGSQGTADSFNPLDLLIQPGVTLALSDIAAVPTHVAADTKFTIIDYSSGSLTGTFGGLAEGATVTVGVNSYILKYADGKRVTLTAVATISPYLAWTQQKGLDGTPGKENSFAADPEADGIANGPEWILGGDPLVRDASSLLTATATANGGLVLKFNREEESIGQATLAVEWDTDLAGGFANSIPISTDIPPNGRQPVVSINAVPDPDAVTVTIPPANATGGRIFARIKASMP